MGIHGIPWRPMGARGSPQRKRGASHVVPRDVTYIASETKRETRDGKGPAPAQEIPRSRAVPTPGPRDSMIARDSLME